MINIAVEFHTYYLLLPTYYLPTTYHLLVDLFVSICLLWFLLYFIS